MFAESTLSSAGRGPSGANVDLPRAALALTKKTINPHEINLKLGVKQHGLFIIIDCTYVVARTGGAA
jgi:hypothetical protein